jgi:hypothetical protein
MFCWWGGGVVIALVCVCVCVCTIPPPTVDGGPRDEAEHDVAPRVGQNL